MSELINEATLKVGMFTGKVEGNKTAEKLGIKIKVVSAANPGNNVVMSGTEEALLKYARRYLGAEEGDKLSDVAREVAGPSSFGDSFDWTSKVNQKVEQYIEEGSCGSVHASYKKGKKLHATYNEEGEYQEFFKGVLSKFGVESPDELSDDKKKEFFEYIDANWEGDNEQAEDTAAADTLVPNGEKKKKDLAASNCS